MSDDVRQAIKFQLLGDLAIAGSLLMRCVAKEMQPVLHSALSPGILLHGVPQSDELSEMV